MSPIRPRATGQQIDALASLLVVLRPGQRAWGKAKIVDALTAAADRFSDDLELLIRASVAAALNASNVTPAVIAMPGRHWETVNLVPHPDPHLNPATCPTCHGPAHPPEIPHYPPPDAIPTADRIREIRAAASAGHLPPPPLPDPPVETATVQGELL